MDDEVWVDVPRMVLIRVLTRLDAATKETQDYATLLDALYPRDLVVHFPPKEEEAQQ